MLVFPISLCAFVAFTIWLPLSARQPEAAARRPHFTDVSPRSQISYFTNNNYTGRKYFQQPMCGGIAILDPENNFDPVTFLQFNKDM